MLHDGGHIEVCHCTLICLAILLSVFQHVCIPLSHYVGMYVHPGLRDVIVIVLIYIGACIICEVKVVPPLLPGHRHIVGEATQWLHTRLFETTVLPLAAHSSTLLPFLLLFTSAISCDGISA
jgi:hypothetical protein